MTKNKANPQKAGRPSKKNTISLEKVKKLAVYGHTEEEIADFFGISTSTLDTYKKNWPEFLGALQKGKEISDAQVVKSLFLRAIGYEHPEIKVFCEKGKITTFECTKYYPPDTAACFIWLKNRRPQEWRDKKELDVIDKTYLYESFEDMTPEELLAYKKKLENMMDG